MAQVSGAPYGSYAAYVQAVQYEKSAYRGYRIAVGKHIRAIGTDVEAQMADKREAALQRLEAAMEARRAARSAYGGKVG